MQSHAPSLDVCVRGVGIVGCTLALRLAQRGLRVALQGDAPRQQGRLEDIRTYALNAASVALLTQVGAWSRLPREARTAIHDMRIEGDAHAQALHFSAWQQRVGELGWIVDAGALEGVLGQLTDEAAAQGSLERLDEGAQAAQRVAQAALWVVAEGKASATRDALGVTMERLPYDQHAVAARLVGERAHQHTAHQWFAAPEILALLPFDGVREGHGWGLVWSVSPERAAALTAMPAEDFERELALVTRGDDPQGVGRLKLASARVAWPLSLASARQVWGERPGGQGAWVLVGDAAHSVHPLAGQGLNLGLGDAQALDETLAHRDDWRPVNDPRVLAHHARRRALPVSTMAWTTDALQRLFAHPSPMARELRNRGLGLVDRVGPLKRWLAGQALGGG